MSVRSLVVVAVVALGAAGCAFSVDGVDPLGPAGDAATSEPDLTAATVDAAVSVDKSVAIVDAAVAADGAAPRDFTVPPDLTPPPPDLTTPDLVDPCVKPGKPPKGAVVAQCVAGSPPTIDGDLGDWNVFAFTLVDHGNSAKGDYPGTWSGLGALVDDPDCSASFGLRWDLQYLYVAVLIGDDQRGVSGVANPTGGAYWRDDTAEIYLDGANAKSSAYSPLIRQIMITADGRAQEYQFGLPGSPHALPSGIVYKIGPSIFQDWTLEMAIPWSLLGTTPASGNLVGWDLQIDDDDHAGGGTRDREVLWWNAQANGKGCDYPYCSPSDFGTVQLGGR